MNPGKELIWPWRESVRPGSGGDLMWPGWELVSPGIDLM